MVGRIYKVSVFLGRGRSSRLVPKKNVRTFCKRPRLIIFASVKKGVLACELATNKQADKQTENHPWGIFDATN